MAKRKWYVITVGKDVGVFDTWLEAAALVKGVPDAIFQGFTSEEEARLKFAQEYQKGNTRIVLERTRTASTRRHTEQAPISHGLDFVYKVESTASPPSTPRSAQPSKDNISGHNYFAYQTPPLQKQHATQTPVTKSSSHRASHSANSARPISRTASEPASRQRRFEIIDAVIQQYKGPRHGEHTEAAAGPDDFEARATSPAATVSDRGGWVAPASKTSGTRTESVRSNSPSTHSESQPKVVVKTPSWLAPYPKGASGSPGMSTESDLLSPLAAGTAFPFNSPIAPSRSHTAPSTPRVRQSSSLSATPASGYLSILPHYSSAPQKSAVDPRSPMHVHAQVPELAFAQPLSFLRPSPSNRAKRLPSQTITPPRSSLLLRPQV